MTRRFPPLRDYRDSRAVLIGNWEYTDPKLPALLAARNSYRRMASLLTSPLCGWPEDRLTRMENQATPGDIPDRLVRAFEPVRDVALFYYVGHGKLQDERLCLCLSKTVTEFTRLGTTSLQFSAIRDVLRQCRARTKIVILDCCFAGQATQASNTLSGTSVLTPQDLPAAVATAGALGTGAYTMAAAGAYETAQYETSGSHPETYFTKYLIDLIERGMPGKPAELKLEPIFLQLQDNLSSDGHPVPERRNIDSGHDYAFAHNAAPGGATYEIGSTGGSAAVPEPQPRPSRVPLLVGSTLCAVTLAGTGGWLLARGSLAANAPRTPAATHSSGTAPAKLEHTAQRLRSLAIHPQRTVHLTSGAQERLTVSALLADGVRASAAQLAGISWQSSNPQVATVGSAGIVLAHAAGSARITARLATITAHIDVVVTATSGGVPTPQPNSTYQPAAPTTSSPTQSRSPTPTHSATSVPTIVPSTI